MSTPLESLAKQKWGIGTPAGTDDEFLEVQLRPWAFEAAIAGKVQLTARMQQGYDHSYFFIATFVDDHLEFHAKHLRS
jgi:S-formylglutathione hydrolase